VHGGVRRHPVEVVREPVEVDERGRRFELV
jgi:hypothetical protein